MLTTLKKFRVSSLSAVAISSFLSPNLIAAEGAASEVINPGKSSKTNPGHVVYGGDMELQLAIELIDPKTKHPSEQREAFIRRGLHFLATVSASNPDKIDAFLATEFGSKLVEYVIAGTKDGAETSEKIRAGLVLNLLNNLRNTDNLSPKILDSAPKLLTAFNIEEAPKELVKEFYAAKTATALFVQKTKK